MSDWQYADWEYALSAVLLVTAMLGMGASLAPQRLLAVIAMPRGILTILALQFVASPLLVCGLSWAMGLATPLFIGLLLVAALPGGLFSNLLTYLGRSNVALSITATITATLACLVVTPAILALFASQHLPAGLEMPVKRILAEILACLVLPLATGMWMRQRFPAHWRTIAKVGTRFSLVLLTAMVIAAVANGRVTFGVVGVRGIVAALLLCQLLLWSSYGSSFLLGFHRSDALAIVIEVVVRNVHLAIFLKASLLPADDPELGPIGDAVLSTVLIYGGLSIIVAAIEVYSKRQRVGLVFGRKRRSRSLPTTDGS